MRRNRRPVTPDDWLIRVRLLEQQLSQARAEVAALRTARDVALKLAAWGGSSRLDGVLQQETP